MSWKELSLEERRVPPLLLPGQLGRGGHDPQQRSLPLPEGESVLRGVGGAPRGCSDHGKVADLEQKDVEQVGHGQDQTA